MMNLQPPMLGPHPPGCSSSPPRRPTCRLCSVTRWPKPAVALEKVLPSSGHSIHHWNLPCSSVAPVDPGASVYPTITEPWPPHERIEAAPWGTAIPPRDPARPSCPTKDPTDARSNTGTTITSRHSASSSRSDRSVCVVLDRERTGLYPIVHDVGCACEHVGPCP